MFLTGFGCVIMWKNIIAVLFLSGYPYISESIIYKFQKIAKSFEESRQYCTSMFDGLAEVYNSEQQQALSLVVDGVAWIGVVKCGENWCYSGSIRRVSYTNWAAGEPNNFNNFFSRREDCVEILSSHKWNDENCSDKNYFVCQKMHCKETTCNRRGTCSELVNGFKCNCERGYYGDKCENEQCKATTCNGRGTCSELPTGFKCKCDQGFYGNNCERVKVCPDFIKPNNSKVECEDLHGENHFQSVCVFTCNQGFILNGNNSTTCQASGIWTTYNTVCQGAVSHSKLILIVTPVVTGAAILLIISVIFWWCRRNHQERASITNDPPVPQGMAISPSSEEYCEIRHDDIYVNASIAHQDLK